MKTIEITTTHKVTIEYELAGLRDRVIASFIDIFIVGIGASIFSSIILQAFDPEFTVNRNTEAQSYMAARLWIPFFFFLSYHFFSELLFNGQSIGKKVAGIRVVKLNGKEPRASDYLLRSLFHFVDTIMSITVLGSMLVLSTDKKQRLGDLAANTTVIKNKSSLEFRLEDILKINSLDDYEPAFPEVKQFTEKDMLLIKSAVARNRQYNNAAHKEIVTALVRDLMLRLDIVHPPKDNIKFLKVLIRDYIVLTR